MFTNQMKLEDIKDEATLKAFIELIALIIMKQTIPFLFIYFTLLTLVLLWTNKVTIFIVIVATLLIILHLMMIVITLIQVRRKKKELFL